MDATEEVNFLTTLLPLVIIIFLIAVGVVLLNQQFHKTLYRQQREKEALKIKHQQEMLRASIEIQEKERQRIARDLHDELGAVLSLTRMNLIQLERTPAEKLAGVLQSLPQVREYIETALASTRRISHELMPIQLKNIGLPKALEKLAHQAENAGPIAINLSLPEEWIAIPWAMELALFRTFNELINNTLKHAEATQISIQILTDSSTLSCRYTDNGKGLPDAPTGSGIGLKSLEGRIDALEGTIIISNNKTGGFLAEFSVPVSPKL